MNLPSSLTRTPNPLCIDLFIKKEDKDNSGPPTEQGDATWDTRRAASSTHSQADPPSQQKVGRYKRWMNNIPIVLKRHCAFIGPGIVASVGYTDPGNWVTDLAAGSQFGYKLLFTVLLSGIFGIFLQVLAVRMGVVTGEDLARNTRLLFLPEERDGEEVEGLKHRKSRVALLWLTYIVSEGALIATELAELIGSAIALNL
jgi:metal iron transporter